MKRLLASVLCAALAVTMQPISVMAAGGAAQGTGSLAGIASDQGGTVMSGVKVQLRNVDTGQLVGNTVSGPTGGFSFAGLPAGNFVIEVVDAAGRIIGTSASIAVAAGAVITGLAVTANAAGTAAALAAGAAGGSFFSTTAGILVLAGVGVGATAGIIAANNDASPSQ